ncbi:MAG: STAS domain-containing protein [Acidobacteriota bacterium]
MLKISCYHNEETVMLKLEGRLMGKYVEELRACYQAVCQAQTVQQICLDLSEVTFVDSDGRGALALIHNAGVEILATNVLTQFIAEEIAAHEKQPV